MLLDTFTPFIHGDVGNAASYPFPVRFKRIDGLTVKRIFEHDLSLADAMVDGARELEDEGVRAITGDCGFMAIYQQKVKAAVSVPVFLTSLLQIPFIQATLDDQSQIGVITASAASLTPDVLGQIGVNDTDALIIRGLEDKPHFHGAAIEETGVLDSDKIREEVCDAAVQLVEANPRVRSILLECSILPPYAPAVSHAVGLPVYDYLTMINYVYSALVKTQFEERM